MTDITRVAVMGAGLMGSGIVEVAARAGYQTVVRETAPAAHGDPGPHRTEDRPGVLRLRR